MNIAERPGLAPILREFRGLPDQPKRDIALRVGELGLAIPEIFPDREAAEMSGEPFLARSEHPCELLYSDLGRTYGVRPGRPERAEIAIAAGFFDDNSRTLKSLESRDNPSRMTVINAEYWRYHTFGGELYKGEDAETFARQHSLSYWRRVAGDNVFMVADSGMAGRYYAGRMSKPTALAVIEDGVLASKTSWGGEHESWRLNCEKLVEYYEHVRALPLFSSNNVPIVELVDPGGDTMPVFLQILPTQDENPVDYRIKTPSESVFFVRGVTPPEGVELRLKLQEFGTKASRFAGSLALSPVAADSTEREALLPITQLYLSPGYGKDSAEESRRRLLMATTDHRMRSVVFRPEVTLGISPEAYEQITARTVRQREFKEIFVRSDGDKAQLQFYNADADEVVVVP